MIAKPSPFIHQLWGTAGPVCARRHRGRIVIEPVRTSDPARLTTTTFPNGYAARRTLTIHGDELDDALDPFHLYFRTPVATDLYDIPKADGFDFRIYDTDDATVLPWDRTRYLRAGGNAQLSGHIRIPDLAAAGSRVLYLYYGKADAPDNSSGPDTFGPDFGAVYHMEDDLADACGHVSALTDDNTDDCEGQMEKARCAYSPAFGYLSHAGDADLEASSTAFTAMLWALVTDQAYSYAGILRKHNGASIQYQFAMSTTDVLTVYLRISGVTYSTADWLYEDTGFHHLAITYDGTTFKLFIDGVPTKTKTWPGTVDQGDGYLRIFRTGIPDTLFEGIIDEFRVAKATYSPAYIAAHHLMIDDPATLYTFGDLETP